MCKARSNNKSGYKYRHKFSTVKTLSQGVKVIQKRDKNDSLNLPSNAETGDKEYILINQQKNVKQIRKYSEISGDKTSDIDLDHKHEDLDEHGHDWVNGKRMNARPLTEEEKETVASLRNISIPDKSLRYYDIDEKLAERATRLNSFDNYLSNSETSAYRSKVDEIFDYAEKIKDSTDDMVVKQKADALANKYAKQYADWINKKNRIEAMCPSILIVGAGNFPIQKKEKQNEMRSKLYAEHDKFEVIEEQIKSLKYYKPKIEKQGKATNYYNYENKYFTVKQNEEQNRIQLFFDEKPSSEMRDKLKHNGFKWSPTNNAWQRQLTPNAKYATNKLIEELKKEEEEG